jgi:hypothetical protein
VLACALRRRGFVGRNRIHVGRTSRDTISLISSSFLPPSGVLAGCQTMTQQDQNELAGTSSVPARAASGRCVRRQPGLDRRHRAGRVRPSGSRSPATTPPANAPTTRAATRRSGRLPHRSLLSRTGVAARESRAAVRPVCWVAPSTSPVCPPILALRQPGDARPPRPDDGDNGRDPRDPDTRWRQRCREDERHCLRMRALDGLPTWRANPSSRAKGRSAMTPAMAPG